MSLLSIDELKTLVEQSQTPCVSLYMPTYRAGLEVQQNSIRFKNLIKQAEAQLQQEYSLRHDDALTLLQPAMELDKDAFWQCQNAGLAIFVAEGFVRSYRLPLDFAESVIVGDRFHLKPLLPLLTGDGRFYVLALSQQDIRLFEGTRYGIEEIELEDVPNTVDEALMYDETAKDGQFRIATSKGGTDNPFPHPGASHGQGSPDRDEPQTDILQFFHRVDQGIHKYVQGQEVPLVLAGVEYLLPLYQKANTYPHLINQIIAVENFSVLDLEKLHQQAWAIVEPQYTEAQHAAIDLYHELAGTGRATSDLKEAVSGAYYGRVDQLFVALNMQKWGNFDPQENQLQVHSDAEPGDQDLLNEAAVQTLLNGGTVYAVEPEAIPDNAPLAAVFRY